MVEVEKACDRSFGRIDPGYVFLPCPDQSLPQICIRQQPLNLPGQIRGISILRQKAGFLMAHYFRYASGGRTYDRRSRQQRFH